MAKAVDTESTVIEVLLLKICENWDALKYSTLIAESCHISVNQQWNTIQTKAKGEHVSCRT